MRTGWLISTTVLALLIPLGTAGRGGASAPARGEYPSCSIGQAPEPGPPAAHSGFVQPFPRISPPAVVQPILHQHDPAPGLPDGFAMYDVGGQQIDAAGNILILGVLEGPDVTASNVLIDYYATADGPQVLFWQSQPAPDLGPDVIIVDLMPGYECLAQDGTVAAIPQVSGPGIVVGYNDYVLFVGHPPELHKALQTGDQAPGCEAGVYINGAAPSYFACQISNNGTLRVHAKLAGPSVTELNDYAVWVGRPDELALVYREGMQAPGCAEGVTFAYADLFVHNDLGQVAFRGGLRGPGVTSANDQGLWFGSPAELVKLAREGDQVFGLPVGVTWKTAGGTPDMDGNGCTGEIADIQGPGVSGINDRVFYLYDAEGPTLIQRKGDPAVEVGSEVTVEPTSNWLVDEHNELFWRVKYSGTGVSTANQWAMYFGPPWDLHEALRDSAPAPTLMRGTTLWRVNGVPTLCAMNRVGDVAAPTQIQGPGVTDAEKVVLWMRHHVLQRWVPLLRTGMEIEGRTLYAEDETAFPCGATGGSDGRHRKLNDSGVLAMRLEFTDGTHGIFRVSFPFGDGNHDGQVDLADWLLMQSCWSGVDNSPEREGAAFDVDADGDVDLADLALFQQLYSGG